MSVAVDGSSLSTPLARRVRGNVRESHPCTQKRSRILVPVRQSLAAVKLLDRRFLDGGHFQDPCIGDKDVQAISDNATGLPGKLAGAVRGGKVRRYGIRSAAGFAYLCDNTAGFIRAAAVVHENLGTGRGERKCTGAAHAARSAGNESGFTGEVGHDRAPDCPMSRKVGRFRSSSTLDPPPLTGTSKRDAQRARDIGDESRVRSPDR